VFTFILSFLSFILSLFLKKMWITGIKNKKNFLQKIAQNPLRDFKNFYKTITTKTLLCWNKLSTYNNYL